MCAETGSQSVATATGSNLKLGSSYKTYSRLDLNLAKTKQKPFHGTSGLP